MNRVRRILVLATALLLLIPGGSFAEVTAETQESNGRVTEITWKDENGNPAAGPEGYAIVRYEYKGQTTTECYYDAEGFPCASAGGYYAKAVTRENRYISKIQYLGADGKLTETNMGYSMVTYRHRTFGDEYQVVFFGVNGRPVIVPSLGYAQVETQHNGTVVTGRTFLNETGKRIDCAAGYAAFVRKLNKQHQIIREWYEHADGSPATGPDGWSKCLIERDGNNNWRIIRIQYFDTQDNLTDAGGWAREEYEYDGDGSATITRYDLSDRKVPFEGEAVSVRRKIQIDLILEETYLNDAGEPVNLADGYAGAIYTYDENGALTSVKKFDAAGSSMNIEQ